MADKVAEALMKGTRREGFGRNGGHVRAFGEFTEGALTDKANLVAQALMAPGNALQGRYNQVEVSPSGSVSPFDPRMVADAATFAGTVGVGGSVVPRPINSLGVGGSAFNDMSASFEDLLVAARQRIAERESKTAEIASSGRINVRMKGKAGTALVGPDMSVPGKFRVTYFDPQGVPNGHVELPTYEEAIKRAILDGFKE